MKPRIAVVGLALAVLLFPRVAFNAEAKDINLGWSGQGSWSTLPYIVAGERGFFEKEGLKVRLITFRGTNLMLTALLAGELDYATILPFLTGASARGLPVKILAPSSRSTLGLSSHSYISNMTHCVNDNSQRLPSGSKTLME
jgi:ABC-type nitrate/sulfonate/bicarbonate transport system substrate-binding protein